LSSRRSFRYSSQRSEVSDRRFLARLLHCPLRNGRRSLWGHGLGRRDRSHERDTQQRGSSNACAHQRSPCSLKSCAPVRSQCLSRMSSAQFATVPVTSRSENSVTESAFVHRPTHPSVNVLSW